MERKALIGDDLTGAMDAGLQLYYKKTDSTLRGNIGREMESLLNHDKSLMIAFALALPYIGPEVQV